MTQAIAFPADQPVARRTLASDVVAPLGEVLGATTSLGAMNWIFSKAAYAKRIDDAQLGVAQFGGRGRPTRRKPTSPPLSLVEAQRQVKAAGLSSDDVEIHEGIRADALKIKIERAGEIKRLQSIVARADPGLGTQILVGATGLAVDFADPVNLATMAFPGLGQVKAAALFAKTTARLGPTASKYAGRAGVGAYEGAVSAAIVEPVDYALDQKLGIDHDLLDSAWNIGLGGMGGSVLHVLGGSGIDLYRGIRLRQSRGIDESAAVMDDVLQRFGQGQIAEVPPSVGKPTELPRPDGRAAEADAAIVPGDVGEFPTDSLVVMPSLELGGDRVELGHLLSLKDVTREYEPVAPTVADAVSPSVGKVYRIAEGDDVIVYKQVDGASGNRELFAVQRLSSDHPDYGAPLSNRRADADQGTWQDDKRMLFVRPPVDLAKIFTDRLGRRIARTNKKRDKQLLRYRPPEAGSGHTIMAELGHIAHSIFKQQSDVRPDLHWGWLQKKKPAKPSGIEKSSAKAGNKKVAQGKKQKGKAPDAVHLLGNYIELKPDTVRGRAQGMKQGMDYQNNLSREAAILLWPVPVSKINDLNEKVTAAWNKYRPTWRTELGNVGKQADRAREQTTNLLLPGIAESEVPE